MTKNNSLLPIDFTVDIKIDQVGRIESNADEIAKNAKAVAAKYANVVFTNDQIGDAKKLRADLNNVKKAIANRRSEITREWNAPLDKTIAACKLAEKTIDETAGVVDKQIKESEAVEDAAKKQRIQDYWTANGYSAVSLDKIWNERWLNHTYSDRQWQADLDAWKSKINGDTLTISNITDPAQNQFLMAAYMQSLDLGKCMAAWQERVDAERRAEELRIAQEAEKKAAEAKRAEEAQLHSGAQEAPQTSQQPAPVQESAPQPEMYFAEFRVEGTRDQMFALNNAIKSIGISMHVLNKGRM